MAATGRALWRLIDPGHMTASENMAWDAALLESMNEEPDQPIFRFEQFDPECVLIGFHQSVEEEVNLEYCLKTGIEVNRRITGGGAIYEEQSQVGWELVTRKGDSSLPSNRGELFRVIGEAVALGLKELGIPASYRPKNDIEVFGRKISGTGGTDLGDAILFHGSLLVAWDIARMVNALKIPTEKLKDKAIADIKQRVTCLAWELPEVPSQQRIKEALLKGFEESLGIRFIPSQFNSQEKRRYQRLLAYYSSKDWIFLVRRNPKSSNTLCVMRKTPGGLVKLAVSVDRLTNRIKQAVITGDFFCTPPRAILDLESKLKDLPYEEGKLHSVLIDFFSEAEMPGVGVEDFLILFDQARREALNQ